MGDKKANKIFNMGDKKANKKFSGDDYRMWMSFQTLNQLKVRSGFRIIKKHADDCNPGENAKCFQDISKTGI